MLLARAGTLSNRMLTTDEPAYLLQADRLRSVEAFVYAFAYRSETKTQVGLIPYLIADLLDARNGIFLARVAVLLALIATGCGLVAITRRFLGSPWPGLAASGMVALYGMTGSGYFTQPNVLGEFFLGAKLEYFQTPFILAGIYALAAASMEDQTARRSVWLAAATGATWAVAVLIKPGAVLLGPLYVLLGALWSPRLPSRRAWAAGMGPRSAAFALGVAVPVALVFVPYLFNPTAAAELRFNLIDLNASYGVVRQQPLWIHGAAMLLGLPGLLLLLYGLAPLLARRRLGTRLPAVAGRLLTLSALAAPLVFCGYLPGQGLLHYLIPVVPLAALSGCGYLYLVLRDLGARQGTRRTVLIVGALAAVYLAAQLPALAAYPQIAGGDYYLNNDRRHFDLDGLVAFIQTHSAPGSTLWVYYDTPELNWLTERHAATRDPQADWLTFVGGEPWFSRTVADLAAEKPALIIGIDQPNLAFPSDPPQPLLQVPLVGAFVQQNYHCTHTLIRGAMICTAGP